MHSHTVEKQKEQLKLQLKGDKLPKLMHERSQAKLPGSTKKINFVGADCVGYKTHKEQAKQKIDISELFAAKIKLLDDQPEPSFYCIFFNENDSETVNWWMEQNKELLQELIEGKHKTKLYSIPAYTGVGLEIPHFKSSPEYAESYKHAKNAIENILPTKPHAEGFKTKVAVDVGKFLKSNPEVDPKQAEKTVIKENIFTASLEAREGENSLTFIVYPDSLFLSQNLLAFDAAGDIGRKSHTVFRIGFEIEDPTNQLKATTPVKQDKKKSTHDLKESLNGEYIPRSNDNSMDTPRSDDGGKVTIDAEGAFAKTALEIFQLGRISGFDGNFKTESIEFLTDVLDALASHQSRRSPSRSPTGSPDRSPVGTPPKSPVPTKRQDGFIMAPIGVARQIAEQRNYGRPGKDQPAVQQHNPQARNVDSEGLRIKVK